MMFLLLAAALLVSRQPFIWHGPAIASWSLKRKNLAGRLPLRSGSSIILAFLHFGNALAETIRRQAESFGAEVILAEVTGLEGTGVVKTVHTDRGDFKGFGILLATGAIRAVSDLTARPRFKAVVLPIVRHAMGNFLRTVMSMLWAVVLLRLKKVCFLRSTPAT